MATFEKMKVKNDLGLVCLLCLHSLCLIGVPPVLVGLVQLYIGPEHADVGVPLWSLLLVCHAKVVHHLVDYHSLGTRKEIQDSYVGYLVIAGSGTLESQFMRPVARGNQTEGGEAARDSGGVDVDPVLVILSLRSPPDAGGVLDCSNGRSNQGPELLVEGRVQGVGDDTVGPSVPDLPRGGSTIPPHQRFLLSVVRHLCREVCPFLPGSRVGQQSIILPGRLEVPARERRAGN